MNEADVGLANGDTPACKEGLEDVVVCNTPAGASGGCTIPVIEVAATPCGTPADVLSPLAAKSSNSRLENQSISSS